MLYILSLSGLMDLLCRGGVGERTPSSQSTRSGGLVGMASTPFAGVLRLSRTLVVLHRSNDSLHECGVRAKCEDIRF